MRTLSNNAKFSDFTSEMKYKSLAAKTFFVSFQTSFHVEIKLF